MMLHIDPHAPQPPFEQLRRQLLAEISSQRLPPGSKLPSVRRLAADLGLAPNTVARTYRELESAGVVATRGRNGTVVQSTVQQDGETADQAVGLAVDFATRMRGLGLDADAIVAHVRLALAGENSRLG